MSVFGADVPFAKDSDERFLGKTAVLGLGYGMGANKFYNEIVTGARGRAVNITREFARETVRDYRYNNQDILTFWDLATDMLDWMVNGNGKREYLDGMIVACAASKRLIFPNGCFLRYNELCNSDGDFHYQVSLKGTLIWKKIYGGMLVENIVQAIARHVVAEQIHEIGKRYRLVLFVHDECVYCVLVDEADEALQYGLAKFRINPSWTDIPLDAEGGHAREYSK
jgi:DNA polymerase